MSGMTLSENQITILLMTSTPLKIGLVGCGKMGQAMLRGWLMSDDIVHITVLDPMAALPMQDKTTLTDNVVSFSAYTNALDMLVLAVKPQVMDRVCADLKEYITPNVPILSIAAGRSIKSFKSIFGKDQPVLRAMPNTPAAIGKGVTGLCPSSEISDAQMKHAQTLLAPLGTIEKIEDESLMDAVTALSGSGPAYVFHLVEVLAKSGVKAGLPEDIAMRLARQTVIGAAALCEADKDMPAATLRENVTSPGGTTEAALKTLMDGAIQKIYDKAILAAKKRGEQLSNYRYSK